MNPITLSEGKLAAIRSEIDRIPLERVPEGAGRPRGPGTRKGWIEGLSMTRLAGPDQVNRLIEFPAIASAVGALMSGFELYQVMVNRLDAGGTLDFHRDGIPFEPAPERWHLPVVTNPGVEYWEESFDSPRTSPELSWAHMSAGSWWGPIRYWELHSMRNLGGAPRTHLIVDLNV